MVIGIGVGVGIGIGIGMRGICHVVDESRNGRSR